ncbi:MAG: OmpH family outer membrane protein [Phycisphaerales bacterium]|jgi:Skp family chaperone for outer membrane proteins
MKTRIMFLVCLTVIVILAIGYEYNQAQAAGSSSAKIGVVSIMKIFKDCKKSTLHRNEVISEQNRIKTELESLSKQIEAQEAGLRALRPDSIDYMAQRKELIDKRSSLEAQQEFNRERMVLKEYTWSKTFYTEILKVTSEIAREKGLDLVLEQDQIDLLPLGVNDIMRTISTNIVLYSSGCVDITQDVMARLDR